jgi:hypothetical protein
MKQNAAQMQGFHAAMGNSANAQDRIKLHTEFAKQRAASMENMGNAFRDLYAALTPDQKATADLHMGGMRFGQAGPRGPGRWR